MRVLVYDDRRAGAAQALASALQEHLPSADLVVVSKPTVSMLELPEVDVIVLPLDVLRPHPHVDPLVLLALQHPTANVLALIDTEPDEDLVRLALSRDVRGFLAGADRPAELALLVLLAAAQRSEHQPVEEPTPSDVNS